LALRTAKIAAKSVMLAEPVVVLGGASVGIASPVKPSPVPKTLSSPPPIPPATPPLTPTPTRAAAESAATMLSAVSPGQPAWTDNGRMVAEAAVGASKGAVAARAGPLTVGACEEAVAAASARLRNAELAQVHQRQQRRLVCSSGSPSESRAARAARQAEAAKSRPKWQPPTRFRAHTPLVPCANAPNRYKKRPKVSFRYASMNFAACGVPSFNVIPASLSPALPSPFPLARIFSF
jgi:hypothetical protein